MTPYAEATNKPRRLALVLWSGNLGGAETFTVSLARALRAEGADARLVFVTSPSPLVERVEAAGIPFVTLALKRGRAVLLHPRRLVQATTWAGSDGAILVSSDYLGAALRLGGYGGRVVAVEHGSLFQLPRLRLRQRLLREAARLSGARAVDVRVAVSEFVASRLNGGGRVVTIPNAVDLEAYTVAHRQSDGDEFVVGCMARLVAGKGVDDLLAAFAGMGHRGARLRIAGDGPERPKLEVLAKRLGIEQGVEFLGWVPDANAFWGSCDVAVVPSQELVESFGLAAVEAMASGRPVVATRNGGLAEVVADGETGFVFPRGDTDALGAALRAYREDPGLRTAHGTAGRLRCEARFDIRRCARSYLALFDHRDGKATATVRPSESGTLRNAWASALSRGPSYEPQTPGLRWKDDAVEGYFVDFREKTSAPGAHDPESLQPVSLAQLALGWWEWLLDRDPRAGARFDALTDLLAHRAVPMGAELRWPIGVAVPKYGLRSDWCSAMAQGQVASVFVRRYLRTRDDRWGERALGAIRPLLSESELVSHTPAGRVLEEAPSEPPSHILNGWIYALWGLWDVAVGLQDSDAAKEFEMGIGTLRAWLPAYDVGWWTRYSLYPHPLTDLAKPFYHRIHVLQLETTARATGDGDLSATARRWRRYDRAPNRVAAVAQKGAFAAVRRIIVR